MAVTGDDGVAAASTVKLWDGAVRIVHWLIALLFAASWYTHDRDLQWHRYAGYAMLTLVLFRIYWGFAGSTTARFSHFVKGPRSVIRYARDGLRRGSEPIVGHNPIGAISVLLLIGLLLTQCLSGLFATDIDGLESGPLSSLVSFDTSRSVAEWHGVGFAALQVLVAVHLAAVLFYLIFRRDNLLLPMVTGRKSLTGGGRSLRFGSGWHAATAAIVIAAIVWAIVRGG